jgi:hypothetical protein
MKAMTATINATVVPMVSRRAERLSPTNFQIGTFGLRRSAAFAGKLASRLSPQELQNLVPALYCAPQRGQYTARTLAETSLRQRSVSLSGDPMPLPTLDPTRIVAVFGAVCVLTAAGCGSSQDSTSTAARDATPTTQSPGPPTAKHEADNPTSGDNRFSPGQKADPSHSVAKAGSQDAGTTSQHASKSHNQRAESDASTTAGGPAGLSSSDCRAAATTIEQASAGSGSSSSGCPAGLSREQCEQAAQAIGKTDTPDRASPDKCPAGLTANECREAAEALGR